MRHLGEIVQKSASGGGAWLPLVVALCSMGALAIPLAAQDTAVAPTSQGGQVSVGPGGQVSVGPGGAAVVSPVTASFAEGERLFRANKLAEAIPQLEQAIRDPGVDEKAYIWLALSYQQVNRPDDAMAILRKGVAKSVVHKDLFWFDLGNLYLAQGKASFAKDMYDSAIAVNSSMAGAFLNRANAGMLLNDYPSARDDYARYLLLDPSSPQKDAIQSLLGVLGKTIADAEQKKAQEEAAKIAAENARKQLLDEVSASLKAAAEDTTNLAAGSGQVQSYTDELPPSN